MARSQPPPSLTPLTPAKHTLPRTSTPSPWSPCWPTRALEGETEREREGEREGREREKASLSTPTPTPSNLTLSILSHSLSPLIPSPPPSPSSIGWTIYGVATADLFIYLSNIVGVLLATLFVFSVYGFAGDAARGRITGAAFLFAAWMGGAGGVAAFAGLSPPATEVLWGIVTNVQLLAFYAAPLSTLAAVLRARDAASIAANWPMTAVSTANACLWSAYGFAIGRPFVWAPNVAGLVLGAVQLGLCLCLPSGGGKRGRGGKGSGGLSEAGKAGAAAGPAARLVTVALNVTPAGRAAGGGARPARPPSRHAAGALSASMARTFSFGQWGEAGDGGGGDDGSGSGWGGALRAAGRRLSASLLGGSSRGLGGSSKGLLGGSSRGSGGAGSRRAWFSAGGEAGGGSGGGGGGGGGAGGVTLGAARAATAGDEEAAAVTGAAAAAALRPPVSRTRTFGQF